MSEHNSPTDADAAADDGHDDHGHDDHGPGHYTRILGLLVVLLVVSVAGPFVADFLPHGTDGSRTLLQLFLILSTAFGIAIVKAYLVVKHFMHLNIEPKFVTYFLVTGLAFMGIFFSGVAPDVMHHEGTHWRNEAAMNEVDRALAVQAEGHDEHGEAGEHHDEGGEEGH